MISSKCVNKEGKNSDHDFLLIDKKVFMVFQLTKIMLMHVPVNARSKKISC